MHNDFQKLLIAYCHLHPQMTFQDVERYVFQSIFGCRCMPTNRAAVEDGIRAEMSGLRDRERITALPGDHSRVHLAYLQEHELSVCTFAQLFIRSTQREDGSIAELEQALALVQRLCAEGHLPFPAALAQSQLAAWKNDGYPAREHSDAYRDAYHPAYRVIANDYVPLLPLLCKIEAIRAQRRHVVVALEGGSAAGKTTLSALLQSICHAAVVHMDDFFLRPEQRTSQRYAEPGGNVDRERFLSEVLMPLQNGDKVVYRPFDCHTMTLQMPVSLKKSDITVIEGAYSMHPALSPYYDLSVFLHIPPDEQLRRICLRNGERCAEAFAARWIPLENAYFEATDAAQRCTMQIGKKI